MAYLFDQRGLLVAQGSEEDVMMAALEAGAEDIRDAGEDNFDVITDPSDLRRVKEQMTAAGIAIESADVTQLPSATIPVGESEAKKLLRLIDALDDLDDVQAVFSNYDIDDAVMEQVMAEA